MSFSCHLYHQWCVVGMLNSTGVMMMHTSPVTTHQTIHDIKKALIQPPHYTAPTAAGKDVNENSSLAYNANIMATGIQQQSSGDQRPSSSPSSTPAGQQLDKQREYQINKFLLRIYFIQTLVLSVDGEWLAWKSFNNLMLLYINFPGCQKFYECLEIPNFCGLLLNRHFSTQMCINTSVCTRIQLLRCP